VVVIGDAELQFERAAAATTNERPSGYRLVARSHWVVSRDFTTMLSAEGCDDNARRTS
jgi:hypothetical protein